jgi:hypothetical protein
VQNAVYVYINSVRTSQETHYISTTKPNRLMLCRETIAVYCENHLEHITLCGHRTNSFSMSEQVVHIVITWLNILESQGSGPVKLKVEFELCDTPVIQVSLSRYFILKVVYFAQILENELAQKKIYIGHK